MVRWMKLIRRTALSQFYLLYNYYIPSVQVPLWGAVMGTRSDWGFIDIHSWLTFFTCFSSKTNTTTATYTFTLDFGLTCVDTNVAGPGINETACLTEIRGQDEVPDDELVPISVQNVQIFELDQNLQVVAQTVRAGSFVNGSNFTYTSIIATMTSSLNPTSLPRGLQLVITGLNTNEETVVNTYIILYDNDCGIFPVLTEGQTAGWTIFVRLLAARFH